MYNSRTQQDLHKHSTHDGGRVSEIQKQNSMIWPPPSKLKIPQPAFLVIFGIPNSGAQPFWVQYNPGNSGKLYSKGQLSSLAAVQLV